jgi:serine/threonine protein kinase
MAFDRWTDGGLETDLDDVLLPGTLLCKGKYLIQSFLSAGGFGITYLARDSQGRDLVLKECFVPDFCRRSQGRVVPRSEAHRSNLKRAIASFLDEAQTISTLSHANIVRAYEAFEENDTAYVVLDFIKGHDLQEIIDDKKTSLSPAQLVGMAQRLISALSHVHGRGLLHCDVSPDNVCVASTGEPILIDFGSARRHVDGVGQPHVGFSMVKDGYSPPEFYTPNAACGPASDVYSLGATLYHAITGTVPVDGQTRLTALIEGMPDPLLPLRGRISGYSASLLASIDRAMSVSATVRFASAKDWLRALAQPAPEAPPKAPLDVLVLRNIIRPEVLPRLHLGADQQRTA